jgi:uncharacterized protein YjdB
MENVRRFESEDNMRQMFVGLVALVMACSDGAGPAELSDLADTTRTVQAAKVDVYPLTKVIAVGQSFRLNVVVRDTEGRAIADPLVVFSATDGTIATVDSDGLVNAQAIGETTITVRSGRKSAQATITVIASEEEEDPCYGCWDY